MVALLGNEVIATFAPRPSGCETGHPSLTFAFGHAAANSFCPDTPCVRFALHSGSTAPEGLSGASRHRAARYPCLVVSSVTRILIINFILLMNLSHKLIPKVFRFVIH